MINIIQMQIQMTKTPIYKLKYVALPSYPAYQELWTCKSVVNLLKYLFAMFVLSKYLSSDKFRNTDSAMDQHHSTSELVLVWSGCSVRLDSLRRMQLWPQPPLNVSRKPQLPHQWSCDPVWPSQMWLIGCWDQTFVLVTGLGFYSSRDKSWPHWHKQ